MLLGDFLVAENSPLQSEISSSMYNSDRVPAVNKKPNQSVNSDSQSVEQELDNKSGMASSASLRFFSFQFIFFISFYIFAELEESSEG